MKKRINKTLNSYSSTSGAFNKMCNYLGAQVSIMYVNSLPPNLTGWSKCVSWCALSS